MMVELALITRRLVSFDLRQETVSKLYRQSGGIGGVAGQQSP